MIWFDDTFDDIREDRKINVFNRIWNFQNFQIKFRLRKPKTYNIIKVNIV